MRKWFLIAGVFCVTLMGCGDEKPADASNDTKTETCLRGRDLDGDGFPDGPEWGLRLRLPLINIGIGPGVNLPPALPPVIQPVPPVQPQYRAPVRRYYYQPQYYHYQRYQYHRPVRIKATPIYQY